MLPRIGEAFGSSGDRAQLIWAPRTSDEPDPHAAEYLRRWATLGRQEEALHMLHLHPRAADADEAMERRAAAVARPMSMEAEAALAGAMGHAIVEHRKDMWRAGRALRAVHEEVRAP